MTKLIARPGRTRARLARTTTMLVYCLCGALACSPDAPDGQVRDGATSTTTADATASGGDLGVSPASGGSSSGSGGASASGGAMAGTGGGSTPTNIGLEPEYAPLIIGYCDQECEALRDDEGCFEEADTIVSSQDEGCEGACVRLLERALAKTCQESFAVYAECLNQSPGFFDTHCEGELMVRADEDPCPSELEAVNSCIAGLR